MNAVAGFIAATRFGLGPRPGELDDADRDARGWLLGQLTSGSAMPKTLAALPSGAERMTELLEIERQVRTRDRKAFNREQQRAAYLAEAGARTRAQIDSERPFVERLVQFWSNHFTVSVQRPPVLGLAGAFEREAIRRHVLGRFRAMLGDVVRHPAMLVYLDNARSIGPNSMVGRRNERGLNENLAREILELHTLGVDGGYTQADVREFARILTGWSIARADEPHTGAFYFRERAHEPGSKTLLGKTYWENGQAEGEAALDALARHPATARHVATKLARHFIADDPPLAAVRRLEAVFANTGGDLRALAVALVEAPEAWAEPLAKVKAPNDFVVSTLRAVGFAGEDEKLTSALRLLGQMPFAATSPAGWPDVAAQWIGPEAVLRRAEWAMAVGLRAAKGRAPKDLVAATIAPVASGGTVRAIERAPSLGEAIATLIASPEFQRR